MTDYYIRPMEIKDANGITDIRRMEGVIETITALPSESYSRMLDLIENMDDNMHAFVAVHNDDETVLGMAWINVNGTGRRRHSASIAIMIHADYKGKRIGTALLEKLIDVSDNYLMLKRLDLEVDMTNQAAIKLYKKFGFEIEGIRKAAIITNGKYLDDYMMARIR